MTASSQSFEISLFCCLLYSWFTLLSCFSPHSLSFLEHHWRRSPSGRNVIVGFVFCSHQVTDNPFGLLAACVLTQHPSGLVLFCFVLISWLSALPWSSISFSISPSSLQEKKIWHPSLIFFCEHWGKKINLIFFAVSASSVAKLPLSSPKGPSLTSCSSCTWKTS